MLSDWPDWVVALRQPMNITHDASLPGLILWELAFLDSIEALLA